MSLSEDHKRFLTSAFSEGTLRPPSFSTRTQIKGTHSCGYFLRGGRERHSGTLYSPDAGPLPSSEGIPGCSRTVAGAPPALRLRPPELLLDQAHSDPHVAAEGMDMCSARACRRTRARVQTDAHAQRVEAN